MVGQAPPYKACTRKPQGGIRCGDVEVEIRKGTRGDISIYSAEGGAAILGIESKNEWWGKPHPTAF